MTDTEPPPLTLKDRARLMKDASGTDEDAAQRARAELARHAEEIGEEARYVDIGPRPPGSGKPSVETGKITSQGNRQPDR